MAQFLKICSRCRKQKWSTSFHRFNRNKDGYRTICKDCDSYLRRSHKEQHIWYRYGISKIDYEIMFKKQKGICSICKQPEKMKVRNGRLSIDHDHKTGKVRGLLCDKCNGMLGRANDDIEILEAAIGYLKKHQ